MTKWSRLAEISGLDFKWLNQNGRHLAAILFLPFEIQTFLSGFRIDTSLDRFIKKRAIKNILFMTKQPRLAKMLGLWSPRRSSLGRLSRDVRH